MTLEDDASISLHGGLFIEEICYRITNFVVCRDGRGLHRSLHVIIFKTSFVEQVWDFFPSHSFNSVTCSEFVGGYPWDFGIIGMVAFIMFVFLAV